MSEKNNKKANSLLVAQQSDFSRLIAAEVIHAIDNLPESELGKLKIGDSRLQIGVTHYWWKKHCISYRRASKFFPKKRDLEEACFFASLLISSEYKMREKFPNGEYEKQKLAEYDPGELLALTISDGNLETDPELQYLLNLQSAVFKVPSQCERCKEHEEWFRNEVANPLSANYKRRNRNKLSQKTA